MLWVYIIFVEIMFVVTSTFCGLFLQKNEGANKNSYIVLLGSTLGFPTKISAFSPKTHDTDPR